MLFRSAPEELGQAEKLQEEPLLVLDPLRLEEVKPGVEGPPQVLARGPLRLPGGKPGQGGEEEEKGEEEEGEEPSPQGGKGGSHTRAPSG